MLTSFSQMKNNAQTVLSEAVVSTSSIWTVADVTLLPTSCHYFASCENEIVKVTSFNVSSNQIYVNRGQDDTLAAAHSKFRSVSVKIIKKHFHEIHNAVNSLENLMTVGSSAVRTLTGATSLTATDRLLFINPSTPCNIYLTISTPVNVGRSVEFKQIGTSYAVTISAQSGQNIDSTSLYQLTDINKYVSLRESGSGYNILGNN